LLNSACLSKELREGLWTEAANYATDIENSLVPPRKDQSSYYLFYKVDNPIIQNIRQFGEVAIVEDWQSCGMRAKLDNCGKACLYLGRAKDHAADVYHFLNLDSKRIVHSHDVTWLNFNYALYMDVDGIHVIDSDDLVPMETVVTTNTVAPIVPVLNPIVHLVLPIDELGAVPVIPPAVVPVPPTVVVEPNAWVTCELSCLGADLSEIDLSNHQSLHSGRVPDVTNGLVDGNIVPLTDVCHLSMENFIEIFHDLSFVSFDPSKLNPSQYKDYGMSYYLV
jgi:hypothetical protein